MANKKIVIGNWKMNPGTLEEAKEIATKTRNVCAKLTKTDVVACPPFPFMPACMSRTETDPLLLGAQSVSDEEKGAHTGEVSAEMLMSLGASHVIAGHSEQREKGYTNNFVSKRIARITEAGMTAVVCVGEKTRDENGAYLEALRTQIKDTLANLPQTVAKKIIIAYEPVWAIGAKEAMKPEDVYEMSLFVKKVFSDVFGADAGLKVKVLYGGSVNSVNAAEIIKTGKVDGLLVGRESVNMSSFPDLLRAVDEV